MNPDELERQIANAPEPKLPAKWRNEILDRAAGELKTAPVSAAPPLPEAHDTAIRWIWREIVFPLRHGWSALAAVWLFILGVNFAADSGDDARAQRTASRLSPTELERNYDQRRLLLAELLGDKRSAQQSDEKDPPPPDRPRSEAPL